MGPNGTHGFEIEVQSVCSERSFSLIKVSKLKFDHDLKAEILSEFCWSSKVKLLNTWMCFCNVLSLLPHILLSPHHHHQHSKAIKAQPPPEEIVISSFQRFSQPETFVAKVSNISCKFCHLSSLILLFVSSGLMFACFSLTGLIVSGWRNTYIWRWYLLYLSLFTEAPGIRVFYGLLSSILDQPTVTLDNTILQNIRLDQFWTGNGKSNEC